MRVGVTPSFGMPHSLCPVYDERPTGYATFIVAYVPQDVRRLLQEDYVTIVVSF